MRKNKQHILAALLSLVLLLTLVPAGWADETGGEDGSDNGGDGTGSVSLPALGVILSNNNQVRLNLVPADKDGTEYADIVNAYVQVDFYLVAKAIEDEKYDTYSYSFDGSAFNSYEGEINAKLVADPEKQDDYGTMLKKFSPIAQDMAGDVRDKSLATDIKATLAENPDSSDTKGYTILKSNLEAGMYLMIIHGSDLTPADYFTTTTKIDAAEYENSDIIVTKAQSKTYEYLFEPQLITVPVRISTADGIEELHYNTAYGTQWSDTLNITAKPDWKTRNGILKITKTLSNYADLSKEGSYFEPATFSFSIVGKETDKDGNIVKDKDGNDVIVYQREVALSVTNPVDEKEVITLDDILIGTSVTVTESYSGAHYTGQTGEQTVVIKAPESSTDAGDNTVLAGDTVSFSNMNGNTHRGGHGIENTFVFTESGWQWVVNGEEQEAGATWEERNAQ